MNLELVFLGLSITSSWGNGHATTFRGLMSELSARGHDVLFLERDVPWYAANRDLPHPPYGRTELYESLDALRDRFGDAVRRADAVIVGSYVPEGIAVGDWVLATAGGVAAFYDIDTPVTLSGLEAAGVAYLAPADSPLSALPFLHGGSDPERARSRSSGRPVRGRSTARSIPGCTSPRTGSPGGTLAISGPTAPTASPLWSA